MENNNYFQKPFCRAHGVLMPLFSLPSEYGIGVIGNQSRKFIDFLKECGASYWQLLPLGPTGYMDSPYQCFSAFAGNSYFIDPEFLSEHGLLRPDQLEAFRFENNGRVDYGALYNTRKKALFAAFENFRQKRNLARDYDDFCNKASFWLYDYADFRALKEVFGEKSREHWGKLRVKNNSEMAVLKDKIALRREFFCFLEFIFYKQWKDLKNYANKNNIMLIGDIPLYVSNDSADVWADPRLFELNSDFSPSSIAGVPPDMFSKNGQLWGNPLYNWEYHKQSGFDWWKKRISWQAELFDIIRLDHFIGYGRYYKIPAEAKTAKNGRWCEAPGEELIDAIFSVCGNLKFIAEDLGEVNSTTKALLKRSGFPGMKLMEYAFEDGIYNLPHHINKNTVVYTGTHDNPTLAGYLNSCPESVIQTAKNYLYENNTKLLPQAIIRECFRCAAKTVIIPLQDYLELDNSARINTPATTQKNWCWRIKAIPGKDLSRHIAKLAKIYERENEYGKQQSAIV